MNSIIKIPLSKAKSLVTIFVSAFFVTLGYLFMKNPELFLSFICRNLIIIRFVGIASTLFFGMAAIFILTKLFDTKPGLYIDEIGIINNSNITNFGLIEWNDITSIETKQVMSTKFLILQTNNPRKYKSRAKGFFSRKSADLNHKTYGSPISITPNSLKISFNDLEHLINKEYQKYKKR